MIDQRGRRHGAGDQPVAHGGIEIVRAGAQTVEMQARAFARGDDEGGGAGALGLRNFDVAIGAERGRDVIDGVAGFAGFAFEIAAGDRDAQAVGAALQQRRDRLGGAVGAGRIVGVVTLHGVVGEREIARRARQRSEMIEARHERKGAARGSAGRRSA